jgi:hypothetical protein
MADAGRGFGLRVPRLHARPRCRRPPRRIRTCRRTLRSWSIFGGLVELYLRLWDGDKSPRPRRCVDFVNLARSSARSGAWTSADAPDPRQHGSVRARCADRLLAAINAGSSFRSMPYALQAIRFGKRFVLVALSGEPVVDCGLNIRKPLNWETLRIAGDTNGVDYLAPCRGIRMPEMLIRLIASSFRGFRARSSANRRSRR